MTTQIEEAPVKVRDVVKLSHLAVAVLTAVISIGGIVIPLAVWKGGVDVQLQQVHEQLNRMDSKLDRITESEKKN